MKRIKIVAALILGCLLVGVIALALTVTMTGSGSLGHVGAKGWSILEECTPAMPGDTRGSFGSAKLTAGVKSDSRFVMDNEITMATGNGSFTGRVSDVAMDNLDATVSVAGPGQFLNVDQTMPPLWFSDANDFLGFTYGSSAGQVASTYGIAVDPVDGGVVVGSYGTVDGVDRYKVIKYTAAGVYVTEFGAQGSGNGQFGGAISVAVAPDQSIWVGDAANQRIQKFTTADGGLTYAYSAKVGSSGSGNGQFGAGTIVVAVDSSGNVFATDRGNERIQKFTSSAVYNDQVAVTTGSVSPYSVAVDRTNGLVYASTALSTGTVEQAGRLEVFDTATLTLQDTVVIAAPGGTSTGIGNIAVDADGSIWAQWFLATYLVRYSPSGEEETRWQSLYPASMDLNTNLNVTAGAAGVYALFRPLNSDAQRQSPYAGNYVVGFDFSPILLSSAIQTYMEACDSTLNGWTLDYQGAVDPEVVFPGWSGNVWAKLKELFAIYKVEMVEDHDTQTFIVRDIGSATATVTNRSPIQTAPANLTGGQVVDVVYQQPRAGGGVIWDAQTEGVALTVAVGQNDTQFLYTDNHPAELAQPVPTDTLPIQPGQYYVVDSLGIHVPALTWAEAGANVSLSIGESPGTISATLKGPSAAIVGYTGPFSFATGHATTDTQALAIVGNGTFTTPRLFRRAASQGQPFNSPFMDTVDRICQTGHKPSLQDPDVTITFSCNAADLPPVGQAKGALFSFEESVYRIMRVERDDLTAQVTAERHVTAADFDTANPGQTPTQYDALWAGYSASDFQIQPLRTA